MALPQDVHRFTVDEFLAIPDLPERTELIDGVIYDMSPESSEHFAAQALVLRQLMAALPDHLVGAGGSIATNEAYSPIPDVAVYPTNYAVRDVGVTAFEAKSALLVVEVAVTSRARDLGPKLRGYATSGLPEYWVVLPEENRLLRHRLPIDGDLRVAGATTMYTWVTDFEFPDGLAAAVSDFADSLT